MPRFAIKDLLASTALVAVGLTLVSLPSRIFREPSDDWLLYLWLIFWMGGWAVLGAAAGYKFKNAIRDVSAGIMMGILIGVVVLLWFALTGR